MKKIFLVIVFALLGLTANAQLSDDYMSLKIGDYVFRADDDVKYYDLHNMGGTAYYWKPTTYVVDGEQFWYTIKDYWLLMEFLETYKKDIEKKYGITIEGFQSYGNFGICIAAYDKEKYEPYRIERENRLKKEKEAKEAKKKKELELEKKREQSLMDFLK